MEFGGDNTHPELCQGKASLTFFVWSEILESETTSQGKNACLERGEMEWMAWWNGEDDRQCEEEYLGRQWLVDLVLVALALHLDRSDCAVVDDLERGRKGHVASRDRVTDIT